MLIGGAVEAQLRSFNQCLRSDPGRVELDNLCPRLEGVHLEGCCPPLRKSAPLQCKYVVTQSQGQLYLTQSSYTTCQNGQNISVSCCTVVQRSCTVSPVTLNYIPRLLHRRNNCCFENCPPGNYWRQAPANPAITAGHELDEGSSPAACTGTVLQECSAGSVSDCQASSPCPVPTPSPSPSPSPSPGPSPSPSPGPSPSPSPSPSPAPSPAPAPPPSTPNGA